MRLLRLLVQIVSCLVVAFLSYRISRLLGHWEYGLLVFISLGYLWNISSYVSRIRGNGSV